MEYIKDNGELKRIAEKIINEMPEMKDLSCARIGYQRGIGRKKVGGQMVYADCRKVPEWLAAFVPLDYIITFYETAERLTDEGLEILMHHELLHIKIEDGKTRIRPHDVQDFRAITDVYGTDWVESFNQQMKIDTEGKE